MKKKKTIIIVLCVLLAIGISAGFGVSTYVRTQNENAKKSINAEIQAINMIVFADSDDENIDKDELYKHLDSRVVTKGKYAVVEDAVKTYLKDYYENVLKMVDFIDDEKFVNILSIENIKNDGPEFENSKAYIEQGKTLMKECNDAYNEINTKEAIDSYIEGKKLSDEQIAFYESVFEEWFDKDEDEQYFEIVEDVNDYLEVSEKAINFLCEHKNSWEIQNDMIMFNNQKDLNEYRSIISEID